MTSALCFHHVCLTQLPRQTHVQATVLGRPGGDGHGGAGSESGRFCSPLAGQVVLCSRSFFLLLQDFLPGLRGDVFLCWVNLQFHGTQCFCLHCLALCSLSSSPSSPLQSCSFTVRHFFSCLCYF